MSLHEKLVAIQTSLIAPKDQYNAYGEYHHRSRERIMKAAKPLMLKFGVTVKVDETIELIGRRYYVRGVATLSDGVSEITATAYAREPKFRKGMDESQITGTAGSYAGKYALQGLFGLDDRKDADSIPRPEGQAPRANFTQWAYGLCESFARRWEATARDERLERHPAGTERPSASDLAVVIAEAAIAAKKEKTRPAGNPYEWAPPIAERLYGANPTWTNAVAQQFLKAELRALRAAAQAQAPLPPATQNTKPPAAESEVLGPPPAPPTAEPNGHQPARAAIPRSDKEQRWGPKPLPKNAPHDGHALYRWLNDLNEGEYEGVLKHVVDWGKGRKFPPRIVDWDAAQVEAAVRFAADLMDRERARLEVN
jgi:hypothetical protein